jgi:diadenosine tetraphosphatase ApaH/serine/threonine PP2A family protein phosphatase
LRILLFSDIHANLEAFEACLAAAPAHDIVVNLGDLVGYGASPNEVIARAQSIGKFFVRGNHDKAVCGLMDMGDFNPIAALAASWTRDQLTAENLEWLRALPHGPVQIEDLAGLQFVHGSPLDEDEYLITLEDASAPLQVSQAPITFFGHTHIQGVFSTIGDEIEDRRPAYKTVGQSEVSEFRAEENIRYLINPGSIGQPRDSDWRAAFALYDTESRVVAYYRVPYDLKSAQDRIFAANLPSRLATRLATGR